MIRRIAIRKDWTISMSEFRKFAEKYQWEIDKLEEENKKLKSDLSECECSMHFENDEVWYRKRECKKLKEELKELEETLEHRDSVLSIMYDLLRSDLSDYEQLCMIDVVIDVEVWNDPQNKLREELLDRFWKRDF
jgi:chromosome segregation ATPase